MQCRKVPGSLKWQFLLEAASEGALHLGGADSVYALGFQSYLAFP